MKIFKNIKDGELYILVELKPGIYTAIPINSGDKPISNCNMIDFVPTIINRN